MSRLRAVVSIATFAAVQGFAVAPAGAASILEDVLDALSGLYAAPLVAMFGNAAINVPTQTMVTATLRAGDQVIIGYDALQNPVQAVADAAGLTVTAEQAASLQSGLQAGLYPAGSALFSLPPAGQLSLYDQSADGMALARAEEMFLSRIDGRVTNIVTGMLFPDLAPTVLAAAYDPNGSDPLDHLASTTAQINSTVLGAVNTGAVVSNVQVLVGGLPGLGEGLGRAKISIGANGLVGLAKTEAALAVSAGLGQMGAAPETANITYNIAVNAMAIDGRVMNRVSASTARVAQITSTVIGAVNGGAINSGAVLAAD